MYKRLRDMSLDSHELQRAIRLSGGIRIKGDELETEFYAVTSPKETGTTGLLNNKSGKTIQEMAEIMAEWGFILGADKDALLDALRRSVGGRAVYSPCSDVMTAELDADYAAYLAAKSESVEYFDEVPF